MSKYYSKAIVQYGWPLLRQLKKWRRLYLKQLASMKPDDPQRWAFEIALRHAYARERFYRRYLRLGRA